MKLIGMMVDNSIVPCTIGDGVASTLLSRDYKGVMVVVISKSDGSIDGEWLQQVGNARGRKRYVCSGEEDGMETLGW